METAQVILLGIIQGLTEFLPVSSSGHLVLLQNLFGFSEPELLLDISLHIGTLFAVCIVFSKEIRSILLTVLRIPGLIRSSEGISSLIAENEQVKILVLIIAGSIPTAILGLFFRKIADQIFGNVCIVGIMLLLTGTLLWFTRQAGLRNRNLKQVAIKDALIIGLAQGIAILPGISRSGSTISTALFLGVNREVAGRYSFLLSIPAILGALIMGIDFSSVNESISAEMILMGTVAAGIVGYLALRVLLQVVKRGQMHCFAPYCWLIGVAAVVWNKL